MIRLCRHWSHKFNVELGEQQSIVGLPAGRCEFKVVEGVLLVTLEIHEENQERMRQVVAEHLMRMASGEKLDIGWSERLVK